MNARVAALIFGAVIGLAACHRAAPPASGSLVGAHALPARQLLRQETIVIVQAAGDRGEHLLNVELSPDNKVTATHTFGTGQVRRDERVIGKESFSLAPDAADKIRQALWRLRPDTDADVEHTVPLGCHYIFDAGYETKIAYATAVRPVLPIFALPYSRDCQSASASEARALIAKTLNSLSSSKVVAAFLDQN